jgi:hypothetical protein
MIACHHVIKVRVFIIALIGQKNPPSAMAPLTGSPNAAARNRCACSTMRLAMCAPSSKCDRAGSAAPPIKCRSRFGPTAARRYNGAGLAIIDIPGKSDGRQRSRRSAGLAPIPTRPQRYSTLKRSVPYATCCYSLRALHFRSVQRDASGSPQERRRSQSNHALELRARGLPGTFMPAQQLCQGSGGRTGTARARARREGRGRTSTALHVH